ncbi:MAG TPA: AAA family ATPase, partial [Actinomycetota bacterium]|nr:AAA family ATPase [Actinomycetota bacterium]
MTEIESGSLHGRATEERRIASTLEEAGAGRRRGAVLLGGPGMGKSVALRRAAVLAAEQGFFTVSVRVPGGIPLPPHVPVPEIVAQLAESGSASGELAGDGGASFAALTGALRERSEGHRLAILIDDFHWAPAEGANLLLSALRAIDDPIAIFLAMRPATRVHGETLPIPESTGDLPFEVIELLPLESDAVESIAKDMLGGDVVPSLVRALEQETQGNPLHIVEAIRDGRAEGWIEHTAGFWAAREGFHPRTMLDSIRAQLERLPRPAFRVAGFLAVLGRPSRLEEIAHAMDGGSPRGPEEALDALDVLLSTGIATEDAPRTYRLSHPLHASALIDLIGPARRAAEHQRALAILRGQPCPASELAYHATRAATTPDDLDRLVAAAGRESEALGAPAAAAGWYRVLVDMLAPGNPQRATALESLARTTAQYDPASSIERYTDALREATGHERARLLTSRARAMQRTGRFDEALADLREALPGAAEADVFAIEAGMGVLELLTGDRAAAEARLAALVERSRQTRNHPRALYHLAAARLFAGDVASFSALSREAMEATEDVHLARSALSNVAWGLILQGRFADAEALILPAIEEIVAAGDRGALFPLMTNASLLMSWKGEIGAAADFALRSRSLADAIGNPADRAAALMCMMLPLLESGTPALARPLAEEIDRVLEQISELREVGLTYLLVGDAYLALGDLDAAHARCRRAERFLDLDSLIWAEGVARLDAEIAIASGEPSRAAEI